MLDDLVYSIVILPARFDSSDSRPSGGWTQSTSSSNQSATQVVDSSIIYSSTFATALEDKNGDSVGVNSPVGPQTMRINSKSIQPLSGIKMTTLNFNSAIRGMQWIALEFMAICFSDVNGICSITVYTLDKSRVEHRQTLVFDKVWVQVQVTFNPITAYNDAVARGGDTAVVTIEATTGDIMIDNVQFRELTDSCVWSCYEGIRNGDRCEPCLRETAICTPQVSQRVLECSVDGYTRTPSCSLCDTAPVENATYIRNDKEECYWVCNDRHYHKNVYYEVDDGSGTSNSVANVECVPCTTGLLCNVGEFATECISTTTDSSGSTNRVAVGIAADSYCTPCTKLASITDSITRDNSRYTTPGSGIGKDDCAFECNAGFYSIGSRCVTCTDTSELQCDRLSGFWQTVACTATSDAKCELCPPLITGRVYFDTGGQECSSRCASKTYPCTPCSPKSLEWYGTDTINVLGKLIDHSVFDVGSTEEPFGTIPIPGTYETPSGFTVVLYVTMEWNWLDSASTQGDPMWSIFDTASREWQYWFAGRDPGSKFSIYFNLNTAGDIYFAFDAISTEQYVTLYVFQDSVEIYEERIEFEANETKVKGYTYSMAMAQRAQYTFKFDITERIVSHSAVQKFALVNPVLFVTPVTVPRNDILEYTINPTNKQRNYSSVLSNNYNLYARGWLNSPGAWVPNPFNAIGENMTIDLLSGIRVMGVVTQGRGDLPNDPRFVTSYEVYVSSNNVNWERVVSRDSGTFSFPGNSDRTTEVMRYFMNASITQYVRIRPMTYNRGSSIRAGVRIQEITYKDTYNDTEKHSCVLCQESNGQLCLPCENMDIPENATVRHFTDPVTFEPGCTWECVGDFVLDQLGTGCRFCPFIRCNVSEYMSDCGACSQCDLSWVNASVRDEVVFTSAGLTRFEDNCRVGCKLGLFQVDVGQDTGTGLGFVCVPCSTPTCNVTQFLLSCTQFSDAVCIECRTCGPGERKEIDCTATANTVCESCNESLPAGAAWRTGCEWECVPDSRGTRVPEITTSVFNTERGVCQPCVAECPIGQYSTNCSNENGFSGCETCHVPEHAFATGAGQLTNNSCPWLCLPWAEIDFTENETLCILKQEAPPPTPLCTAECEPGWWVDPLRENASECECTGCPNGKPNGTLTVWVGYPVTLTPCTWLCVPPYAKNTDGTHCVSLLGIDSILRLSGAVTEKREGPVIVNETLTSLVESETTITWVPPVLILLIVIAVLCLSRVTRRRPRTDTYNGDEELSLR
jgi:hypothetical protein